jgi:hypothetical protein
MASRLSPVSVALLLMVVHTAHPLVAQTKPSGVASFSVQVIDEATGRPILRVLLTGRGGAANAGAATLGDRADTTGFLVIDSIPAGAPHHYEVSCDVDGTREKLLDSVTVALNAGERHQWSVRASAEGCDQRPFIVREGVFTGYWKPGPDQSAFASCDLTIPHAWVEFRAGTLDAPEAAWPPDLDRESSPAFVRWDAEVIGPWHYGPKGDAEYFMTVRRVYELRGPKPPGDCRR